MCGRYTRARNLEMLRKKLRIWRMVLDSLGIPHGYNVAPTQKVNVFRMNKSCEVEEVEMRWGLYATWSPAPIINAMSETISTKPMFKEAFRARRCAVPAGGFYEWEKVGSKKQPYYVTLKDQDMLFAGIWSTGELEACAILTASAPKEFQHIHTRVPLILTESEIEEWINPKTSVERLDEIMKKPTPSLTLTPVSSKVGNVKNDGPELIQSVTPIKKESNTPLLDFT